MTRDEAKASLDASTTDELEAIACAAVELLADRAAALAFPGDRYHKGDALTAIESLAQSAREAESR